MSICFSLKKSDSGRLRRILQGHSLTQERVLVLVEIEMTDAAGVYQVDSLLKSKIHNSGLEDLLRVVAVHVRDGDEDSLVERIEL